MGLLYLGFPLCETGISGESKISRIDDISWVPVNSVRRSEMALSRSTLEPKLFALLQFHARMMEGATGSKVKMYVLSYHDTTLIPILKFMNIDTIKHFPRFSASLHFQVFTRAAGSGQSSWILYFPIGRDSENL